MQNRIKSDRSPLNLNKQPDLFNNLPYFLKEFNLRKYEIEDLYIQRQARKRLDSNPELSLLRDMPSSNPNFLPQGGSMHSLFSNPLIPNKDVIHVTLEAASM